LNVIDPRPVAPVLANCLLCRYHKTIVKITVKNKDTKKVKYVRCRKLNAIVDTSLGGFCEFFRRR